MPYTKTALDWSDGALQSNGNRSIENQPRICKTDTAPAECIAQAKNAPDTDFSHAELLERLTDATEAQLQDEAWLRETRIAIADAFFDVKADSNGNRVWWFSGWLGWETIEHAPDWLHSVDAALTLRPEGWSILEISECVTHYIPGNGWFCSIQQIESGLVFAARARTLPLAICIVSVNALAVV